MKLKNINSRSLYSEKATLWIINKYYWKNKICWIATLILPLIWMFIYYAIAGSDSETLLLLFSHALPVFILLAVLPNSLIILPSLLIDLKTSIMLRRIANSNVTPFKYNVIVFNYFLLVNILSTVYIFLLFCMFLNVNLYKYLTLINWGQFIYALIVLYFSVIAFAIFLGIILKRNSVYMVGFGVLLLSLILTGQFIPLYIIGDIEAMRYLMIISPLNGSIGVLNNVLIKSDLWLNHIPNDIPGLDLETIKDNLNAGYDIFNTSPFIMIDFEGKKILHEIPCYTGWQKIFNLVLPWIVIVISFFIANKKFTWVSR